MKSPHSTRWDVYRDKDGNPVTIDCDYGHTAVDPTEEQIEAARHAARVWEEVCQASGSSQADGAYDAALDKWDWTSANMAKSRLLGRMIHYGRPPHDYPPPLESAGGWWDIIETGWTVMNVNVSVYDYNGKSVANILGSHWECIGAHPKGIYLARPNVPWVEKWIVRPSTEIERKLLKFDGVTYLGRMDAGNVMNAVDFAVESKWN